MYYAERHDEAGNWYYRTTPDGEWYPFTSTMLCKKIEEIQKLLVTAVTDECDNNACPCKR